MILKKIDFLDFAEDLCKGNLTFNDSEKEQERIFKAINELKKRLNPNKGRIKDANKKNGKS